MYYIFFIKEIIKPWTKSRKIIFLNKIRAVSLIRFVFIEIMNPPRGIYISAVSLSSNIFMEQDKTDENQINILWVTDIWLFNSFICFCYFMFHFPINKDSGIVWQIFMFKYLLKYKYCCKEKNICLSISISTRIEYLNINA